MNLIQNKLGILQAESSQFKTVITQTIIVYYLLDHIN